MAKKRWRAVDWFSVAMIPVVLAAVYFMWDISTKLPNDGPLWGLTCVVLVATVLIIAFRESEAKESRDYYEARCRNDGRCFDD